MKNAKYILAVCLLAVATAASAQFANNAGGKRGTSRTVNTDSYSRIYVGYNPTTFKIDNKDADDVTYSGFTFGYTHGFSVSKKIPFFIEVGARLNYSFKKQDFSEYEGKDGIMDFFDEWDEYELGGEIDVKHTHMNIAVPVNLAYKWQLPNSEVAITPFVGVTFKYNLIAKTKINLSNELKDYYRDYDDNDEDDKPLTDINHFDKNDVGKDGQFSRFQVGWQIGAGLSYRALYIGFHYGSDFGEIYKKVKTSNWGLSLGYNF